MRHVLYLCLAAAFAMSAATAHSVDFREAPPRMKDAEEQGLARVDAEALRKLLRGPLQFSGESYRAQQAQSLLVFSPDGTVERRAGDGSLKGKWSIDDQKNVYCTIFTFPKRGLEENCFAVFRAPDGVQYFDHDVSKGLRAHAWRPAERE